MALRLSTGMRNALLGTNPFKTIFAGGVIDVYGGTQPTSADDVENGTKLIRITASSGAFTAGTTTNGLNFGDPANGAIAKAVAEIWSGLGLAAGTATWFRFYANDVATGASTTAIRFDGSVSTSGAQLNMSSTSITVGATTTIDSFSYINPAS